MRIADEMVERAAHVLAHAPAAWTVEQEARAVLEALLPDIAANALGATLPDGRRLVGQVWMRDDGKNEYKIVGGTGLDRARLAREFAGLLFQWLTELCELMQEAEAAQRGEQGER